MRSAVRFPLKLPVEIKSDQPQKAETMDISAGGVLFYAQAELPVGSTLEFNICLPASVLGTETDVRVRCAGRVVRSFVNEGRRAVAAVIDEYWFERS